MNLAHLIFFDFFRGASGIATITGPWVIAAQDAYSAGAVAMDAWDADSQIVQDDFSAGAVAIDG